MYRTYRLEGNEKFVIGGYDGDCTYYTVCENEQEYEEEKARLAKIDEEYKLAKQNYLANCTDY